MSTTSNEAIFPVVESVKPEQVSLSRGEMQGTRRKRGRLGTSPEKQNAGPTTCDNAPDVLSAFRLLQLIKSVRPSDFPKGKARRKRTKALNKPSLLWECALPYRCAASQDAP